MACGTGKVYTNGPFPTINSGTELNFIAESYMDNYPNLLVGMSCEDSRQYLLDNSAAVFGRVVKDGSVMPRPDASNTTLTGELAGYQVYISTPTGSQEFYGTWSISEVDGVVDEITWPGGWPLVMGVNAGSVYFNRVASAGNPNDGFILDATADNMAAFDFNSWWCCAAAARGCTEGCGGGFNPYAARFLIPPPETPGPGEENVTQPPLNSLLLLSNHTFQFPPNYGVKRK